jgi:hypothetical protein
VSATESGLQKSPDDRGLKTALSGMVSGMDNIVSSNISRVVAFVLVPILMPVTSAVASWLQDVAGIDLTGESLAIYVTAVAAGVALMGYKWLHGRSEWEKAVELTTELHDLGTQPGSVELPTHTR